MSISGFAVGRWLGLIGTFQRFSLSSLTRWGVRLGFGTVGRSRMFFDLVMSSGIADRAAFQTSPVRGETMDDWFAAFGQHDVAVIAELFRKIAQFDLSDVMGRIVCHYFYSGAAFAGVQQTALGFLHNRRLPFLPCQRWNYAQMLF